MESVVTRNDIVSRTVEKTGLLTHEVRSIFNATLSVIKQEVFDNGNKVNIIHFGSFSMHKKNGRIGRNPKTGEVHEILAREKFHFAPAKAFRNKVSKGEQA